MRKIRKRAVFKSLCREHACNVENVGLYWYLLSRLNKVQIKHK